MGIDDVTSVDDEPGHDPRRSRSRACTPARDDLRLQHDRTDGERVGGSSTPAPATRSLEDRPGRDQRDHRTPTATSTVDENESEGDAGVLDEDVASDDQDDPAAAWSSSGGTGERRPDRRGDEWGKTGTTENNGDAWFCGGTDHFTACVWVGHAQNNDPDGDRVRRRAGRRRNLPGAIWARSCPRRGIYASAGRARGRGRATTMTGDDVAPSGGYGAALRQLGGGGGSGGGGSGGGGGGGGGAPAPVRRRRRRRAGGGSRRAPAASRAGS